MNTLSKSSTLELLEDLAACPDWESTEWNEAVTQAICAAILEVQDTASDLAALLSLVNDDRILSNDRERALNAALEEWDALGTTQSADAVRLRAIRERLRVVRRATQFLDSGCGCAITSCRSRNLPTT